MQRFFNNLNRIVKRNKGFLLINISGLAIGLAVSLMLILFVATEMSYDRHFENSNRIFRLNTIWIEEGKAGVDPICLRSAYTEIPEKVPGIEAAVQIYRGFEVELVQEEKRFPKTNMLYADPQFFQVFSMKFLQGNPVSALTKPGSAVITKELAEIVFGSENAFGKSFRIDEIVYTVTGVVQSLPVNTHFRFDVLASMQSIPYLDDLGGLEFFTYYLLSEGVSIPEVCQAIQKEYVSHLTKRFADFNIEFDTGTDKLTDIYLHSRASYGLGARGSMQSVLILAALSFMILLLAITNFVNLFIVQGDRRALEVGIRKTNGGSVKDIAYQFFEEAAVIVIAAFLLGAFIASVIINPFANLIHKTVEPALVFSPPILAGVLGLILITIVLSASYPAFFLSRFRPVDVLKKAATPSRRSFTTAIVIFQSVITIVLISVILTVNKQINYLSKIPKGFNTEQVMVIDGLNQKLVTHYEALRQELRKLSEVEFVSAAQHTIGGGTSGQGVVVQGSENQSIQPINEYRIFPGLCELMKFELIQGSFFSENHEMNKKSIVINESAAKMLGISGAAVGKKLVMFEEPMEVTGVVRDFYYDSPGESVQPIALTSYAEEPRIIYIRFNPEVNKASASRVILPVFRQYDPEFIMNPRWCDDIYSAKLNRERSFSGIITAGTILSLFIALLGLFAIHAYSVSKRTKEIGIRKIHGGKAVKITGLLSAQIIRLVFIAGIISIPVSWIVAQRWLSNYANHVSPGLILFILPVILQLFFAILATVIVSIRVATRNPAEALRYE